MRVIATQYEDSVVCTLPQGREVEIIMVSAEGDECHAEPNLNSAQDILIELSRGNASIFESKPEPSK